ncbi:cysteine hydrolase family protein [Celeribacter litoreus]|uniref:cysteine hydrolase family protein n=1 Tax=Celeribacter litoreus TaxID=2876714 RepID=UPI001CCF9F9C|nr:isochorismatase family cysteine hydrolase [Celeribacter litoreus]MCA0042497.1 cysteine hydrolase [Celeribacter litoreus]
MSNQNRHVPMKAGSTALLIIDVQNGTLNDRLADTKPWFYEQATTKVVPNIQKLMAACRAAGIEVIYTVMESLTLDGRDRSLDYKLSNFNYPKGCWEAKVIDDIAPQGDEIVLPKTSSSLFNSTNFDYVMRNLGVSQILVTGFLTDQCVDQTVRDGADRGYFMTCITDGCTTETQERHDWALSLFKGYCRQATTDAVLSEID